MFSKIERKFYDYSFLLCASDIELSQLSKNNNYFNNFLQYHGNLDIIVAYESCH